MNRHVNYLIVFKVCTHRGYIHHIPLPFFFIYLFFFSSFFSCLVLSELIDLLVVMGWAGNIGDPLGGPEHPGHVGSGAPACPNTQPCGLCE